MTLSAAAVQAARAARADLMPSVLRRRALRAPGDGTKVSWERASAFHFASRASTTEKRGVRAQPHPNAQVAWGDNTRHPMEVILLALFALLVGTENPVWKGKILSTKGAPTNANRANTETRQAGSPSPPSARGPCARAERTPCLGLQMPRTQRARSVLQQGGATCPLDKKRRSRVHAPTSATQENLAPQADTRRSRWRARAVRRDGTRSTRARKRS